jgi:hypothetical protein
MKNKKHSKLKNFINALLGKSQKPEQQDSYIYEPSSSDSYNSFVHNYRLSEPGSRIIGGETYSARSVDTPGMQFC